MTFPNPPRLPDIKGRVFLITKYGLFSGLSLQAYYLRISIPEDDFDPVNWQNDPLFVEAYEKGMKNFASHYDIAEITLKDNLERRSVDVYIFLADKEMAFFSNN